MKAVIFIHVLYLILMKTFMVKAVTKCESKVELRAVLLSCPTKDSGCDDDDPLSQAMKSEEAQILQADSKNFESLREEKERGFPNAVKDCKRKLVITLKIKNLGKIPCDDEYIVVDHVFDPVTGGRGRLLTPVVLKLRQEQMIQLYGLQFQRVVNSDPFEEQKAGDKTCSIDPENPTCGIAMYDGKPIPFSEGFCCSCDPHVNAKRQLSPLSRGDSFLYRDSKLISQGNARFIREEKPKAIVNPELVQLRLSNSDDVNRDKKGSDCGGIGDPLSWEKIPNYLIEHDRKIVCDKGDFMSELCKLREDKNEAETTSRGQSGSKNVPGDVNNNNDGMSGLDKAEAIDVDKSEFTTITIDMDLSNADSLNDEQASNVILLKNFIKALNMDQTTTSDTLPEGYDSIKGSRGKRENRKENKKLSLEEKLDRFANSKKHLSNRRKRLLELSHRRFRKVDERCGAGQECQTIGMPAFVQDDYIRSPPPKYFFSHDKFVIDPLESSNAVTNATTKSSKNGNCQGIARDKAYAHLGKNEVFKNVNAGKEGKIQFYQRQSNNENKVKGKGSYNMGKMGSKKERVSHGEEGRMESGIKRGKINVREFEESMRGATVPIRGEKRFNLFKGIEEKEGHDSEKEKNEETETVVVGHHRDQKNRLNARNFKGFFHKTESDKKMTKSKIRNFFIAKNRERQKMKSELVKGRKKVELNDKEKEGFEGKNYKEQHLKENSFNVENRQFEGKKMGESEEEKENLEKEGRKLKEQNENQESVQSQKMHEVGTEKFRAEVDPHPYLTESQKAKEIEKFNEERNYLKQVSEKKSGANRKRPSDDLIGEMDFDVEIIQNTVPETSKRRFHSGVAEKFIKNRVDASALETKIHDLTDKMSRSKSKQYSLLHQNFPQRYYVFDKDRILPHDVYLIQSDKSDFNEFNNHPRYFKELLDSAKIGNKIQPNHNTYFYKKPLRRYYVPVTEYVDNAGNLARPYLQPYLTSRDDKSHGTQLRGKRYSESLRKREDSCKKVGYRPETAENSNRWHHDKIRNKRSASYSFHPARGFFRSEFDSRKIDDHVVHELATCLSEQKVDKNDWVDSWANKLASWQFPRLKRENSSIDPSMISTLQQLYSRFNYPLITSRSETTRREKVSRSAFDKQRLLQSYFNAPDYVLEEVETALKGKRQSNDQEKPDNSRDGKTCDKDTYAGEYTQDTAHCMRFGDLWYSMYTIKKPIISQTVGIQLFDKHSLCDGTSQWRDLTKGKMIRIGTFLPKAEDELPTISITFMGGKTKKVQSAIDPDSYYLLIPSHVSDPSKVNFYPQFDGGPAEYLLVQSKDISSGGECNMIGTSFEAFARQPDRCTQRRGSCLKRQPIDLWREDMEARIRGKRGKYFVENFGTVPNSSVKTYTNLTGEFLALEYYGEYTSTIEIEVKADSNAIVRKGSNAQIPLVYIDSTYPKKTRIILSVLNIGLTSSYFRPRLGDCPPDLDPAWCPLEGPLVTIPPQQRHDFKLDLSGALPNGHIYVSVQVLNQVNKKIAFRKIIIKKGDRCVCAFHCKCNCIGNLVDGRTCHRLSLEEYRKAGYIGSYPFRGGAAASATESILGNIHIVFLTASYVLLFLGVMKGILGIFIRRIGIAGIRVITGPRELYGYYECELQGCSVLYDECGFPVHPTTCQPVQIVPIWLEMIINFMFFFLYPLRGIWFLLLSLPCCRAICSDCDGCCRHDEGDSDHKCSRPLLSKEPNPTCVHYNLTTVNSKKSKEDEYLPYPAYKGDDDPLEEDDTEFVLQEMKRYRKK